jgi:hypothetical protein
VRIFLIVVGALIGGLLLFVGAVVLYFHVENVKGKRDVQPVYAQMDVAFGRVPLPDGYTVVRSERQGGYYSLFGYQSPGEFRVYAAPRGSGVADLKSALESAGFSIGQDYACTLIADRGSVNLYIEFHRYDPAVSLDITGVQCSPTSWPNVYVWVDIGGAAARCIWPVTLDEPDSRCQASARGAILTNVAAGDRQLARRDHSVLGYGLHSRR